MKAVNLIPVDARRAGRGPGGRPQGPALGLIAALGIALAFVTIYVLTSNTISDSQAKIASIDAQVTSVQNDAARLSSYVNFAQLALTRAETVREIAATRFDWHGALAELSQVVPANTSLQTLFGSVAPGASVEGGGGAGITASLRGAIAAPAFELTGCTSTQDDVARLMSRLRLINGVTRVTLADSHKPNVNQGGASVAQTGASTTTPNGCGPNTPSFDLVVFFVPLAGAGPSGVTSLIPQTASNTTATSAAGGAR